MTVIVDTSVWSLALRRKTVSNAPVVQRPQALIEADEVWIIGPIRQELLSGVREQKQFQALKSHLAAFPDLPLTKEDFERAAEYFNLARWHGIQGSNTDFLICSVAVGNNLAILTTNKDFVLFQQHLPIVLITL